MSGGGGLGWLASSSSLPSQRREIRNVSSRTMFDLKAALYAKEEERRVGSSASAPQSGSGLREGGGGRPRKRRRRAQANGEEFVGASAEHNAGVDARRQKDELSEQRRNVEDVLAEKAKLYDQLVVRRENALDRRGDDRYLVDFERKAAKDEDGQAAVEADGGGIEEQAKQRLRREWESEAMQASASDDEDDNVPRFAKEGLVNALAETEETERRREQRQRRERLRLSSHLERLKRLMKEQSARKFLDLEELGRLSADDVLVVSRYAPR